MLATYDTVIYGGGLYASGINGVKLITKNLDKLKNKKVIVFATGATPTRQETTTEMLNAYSWPVDFTDRKNIAGLVACVRN